MPEEERKCENCDMSDILYVDDGERKVLVCHGPMMHDSAAIACLDEPNGYPGWRPRRKKHGEETGKA